MICASISELPCDIMSPTGAKRKLMICASISELPCDIMSPTGAKRKLMTCASISELSYNGTEPCPAARYRQRGRVFLKERLFLHPGIEHQACQVSEHQCGADTRGAGGEASFEDAEEPVRIHGLLDSFP